LDAFDRLAPDYVSGGEHRKDDITRLRSNLLFIAATTETLASVDEWVALTEAHYAAVERDVAEFFADEHRLGAHEYGLRAA
jgi:hypothetical protein